ALAKGWPPRAEQLCARRPLACRMQSGLAMRRRFGLSLIVPFLVACGSSDDPATTSDPANATSGGDDCKSLAEASSELDCGGALGTFIRDTYVARKPRESPDQVTQRYLERVVYGHEIVDANGANARVEKVLTPHFLRPDEVFINLAVEATFAEGVTTNS